MITSYVDTNSSTEYWKSFIPPDPQAPPPPKKGVHDQTLLRIRCDYCHYSNFEGGGRVWIWTGSVLCQVFWYVTSIQY